MAVLLVAVIVSRLSGIYVSVRKDSESLRDRAFIMIGTLAQGEVGMVIAAYLFSRGLVNPLQFDLSITVVVMLTMIAPVLMRITMKMPLRRALELK